MKLKVDKDTTSFKSGFLIVANLRISVDPNPNTRQGWRIYSGLAIVKNRPYDVHDDHCLHTLSIVN